MANSLDDPVSIGCTRPIRRSLRAGHGDTQLSREQLDKFCAWIDLGVPFGDDYVGANIWSDQAFSRYIKTGALCKCCAPQPRGLT